MTELRFVDEAGNVLADLDTATEGTSGFAPRAGSADTNAPVTDTLDVVLAGGTAAAIRAVIEDVEQALALAARRAKNPASVRVYLEWQIPDGTGVFATEIMPDANGETGRMIYDKRQLNDMWPGKVIEASLAFVHAPHWDKNADTECSLTNAYGTGTGGRQIVNHNDTVAALGANPGFETLGGGDPDFWASWTEVVSDGVLADGSGAGEFHGGAHAAKITAGPTMDTIVTQAFVVVPGLVYTVTFWTRGDAVHSGRYFFWDVTHAALIGVVVDTLITAAVYAQITATFTAPAACVSASVNLMCPAVNAGIAYFDDVTITPNYGGHNNWVEIAAVGVTGDQPTPARIELTNTDASADQTHDIWIGHNVASTPATAPQIFEGEDAASGGGVNTPTIEATCSAGYYGSCVFTQVGVNEYQLYEWDLTTANLDALRSGYFRLLARWFSQPYTDLYIRPAILFATSIIWQGDQLLLSQNVTLQEIAVRPVQLPPWPRTPGTAYPLHLALYAQRTTAALSTVGLDFVAALPTDSWLRLVARGAGLPANARIVADGILGLTYEDGLAVAGQYEGYTPYPYGASIMLWPGALQRIYVLVSDTSTGAGSAIGRTSSLIVKYRERRRVPV